MTQPTETAAAAPPAPANEAARRFAIDAARLASYTRCVDVVVLDVSRVSPVTDFFLLATGSSGRQMRAVADQIEDLGRPQGFKALGRHGHAGESSWMLTDFVDVVVHVFSPDARGYYDLDGLWGDAPTVDWQTGAPPPPNRPAIADADDDEDDSSIVAVDYGDDEEADEDDADEEEDGYDEADEDAEDE